MHHVLPDNRRKVFRSYGEDCIDIHKGDRLATASTLLLIFALGCCIYLYGMNQRAEKNLTNPSSMIRSQHDVSLRSQGIQ